MEIDQFYRTRQWFERIKGEDTLRVDYKLSKDSIVFDIGGYIGGWSDKIYKNNQPKIYIFEPIKSFYNQIEEKFKDNKDIRIFNFGLGAQSSTKQISIRGDASSTTIKPEDVTEDIKIEDINKFLIDNNISHIDLMKINIEGGEYDLLNRLIETDFISKISDVQIQFHIFVNNAKERMQEIQDKLGRTHYLTYQFDFVEENWRRKVDSNDLKIVKQELKNVYRDMKRAHNIFNDLNREHYRISKEFDMLREKNDELIKFKKLYEDIMYSRDFRWGSKLLKLPRNIKKTLKRNK